MNNFMNQFLEIGKTAYKAITDKLDKVGVVHFLDQTEDAPNNSDEFYDLPTQVWFGKYGETNQYYLTKIYKEGTLYYASGLDNENNENYEFLINTEIDNVNILAIADLLNNQ